VAVTAVALASAPLISGFVHERSVTPILWLAASVPALGVQPVIQGMLQGRERFAALAVMLAVAMLAKFALGVAAVGAGLGVSGVLAGAALAGLAGCVVGGVLARVRFGRGGVGADLLHELWRATLGLLALNLAVNLDIVLARHFLAARHAGLYAVGSLVEKVAFWGPAFIVVVVFPQLVDASRRRVALARALRVMLVLSVAMVLVLGFVARPFVRAVFGPQYQGVGGVLWAFAATGAIFSVIQLLVFSSLASGRRAMTRVLVLAAGIETGLIVAVFHRTITQLISVVAIIGSAALVAGLLIELRGGPPTAAVPAGERGLGAGGD